jgi:hypothetical protein
VHLKRFEIRFFNVKFFQKDVENAKNDTKTARTYYLGFFIYFVLLFFSFKKIKNRVKKLGNNTTYAFLVEKEFLLNKKFIN